MDPERFSAVVGNPPYQIQAGGKNHQVYADFYLVSCEVGTVLSMVFPLGWQTSTGRASGSVNHHFIREDKSLQRVDNYYEDPKVSPIILFPGTGTGGVSVVLRDADKDASPTADYYEYGELVEKDRDFTKVSYWSDETDVIFQKLVEWMKNHQVSGMNEAITGWNPFGVVGFMTTDPQRPVHDSILDTPGDGCYKAWTYNKSGGGYGWWYFPKNSIQPRRSDLIDVWKVMMVKFNGAAVHRMNKILAPGEIHVDTFVSLKVENEQQGKNFLTYLKTLCYRFLLSEAAGGSHHAGRKEHRFVPNLSTITNPRTGLVGWDSDWTDTDLQELFKNILTVEEWEYIKKTALDSDGARR